MTEPIRVLQVVTHMNRGGLETMLMNYYRHIDRSKVQFDFLTHRPEEEKKDYDDEIQTMGGKIYHMPLLNPFSKRYLRSLDDFFKVHSEYQIVHSHLDCMSTYPLKIAKRNKVPVRIAHSHNTCQEKNFKYYIKEISKRQIPKYATHLFACGEKAGKWMFGGHEFKIMKNAINAKKFSYNPIIEQTTRKELGLENKFIVGHIGRFNKQKNHEFLINWFSEYSKSNPSAVLVLIGDGELKELITRKIFELGIEEKVYLLGVRSDVSELLQIMDVFVFPSFFEGFPVTLIEAQAAGIPCVISDSITKEIQITDLVMSISLNDDKEVWSNAVDYMSQSGKKATLENIIQNGFDIENNARWLEEFYINVK